MQNIVELAKSRVKVKRAIRCMYPLLLKADLSQYNLTELIQLEQQLREEPKRE